MDSFMLLGNAQPLPLIPKLSRRRRRRLRGQRAELMRELLTPSQREINEAAAFFGIARRESLAGETVLGNGAKIQELFYGQERAEQLQKLTLGVPTEGDFALIELKFDDTKKEISGTATWLYCGSTPLVIHQE